MVAQAKPVISAVDLFCGAGGLTHGLRRAGVQVRLGIDSDDACAYPYERNNRKARFLHKAVEKLTAKEIAPSLRSGDISLLAGCAPCQTFSSYNPKASKKDERWGLLGNFAQLVEELRPALVTMENVPGLARHAIFEDFLRRLKRAGYHCSPREELIVDCSRYGVPQHRRRLVLLASMLGPVSLLSPEQCSAKRRTVRDTIAALSPIEAGQSNPQDPLHSASALSEKNQRRIRHSRPGGTWRDWPEELRARCHTKASGRSYQSVYARMGWDAPAPTMTTQFYGFGTGRFGHPEQHRALSIREGALLQGFPLGYEFVAPGRPVCRGALGRLIGNAVPVALGKVIGQSLLRHAEEVLGRGES